MKAEPLFQPAGRAALHCDALFAVRVTDKDRLAALDAFAGRVGKALAERVSLVLSVPCQTTTDAAVALEGPDAGPAEATHLLYRRHAPAGTPAILASIEAQGFEQALGRMFGGSETVSPGANKAGGKDSSDRSHNTPLTLAATLLRERVAHLLGEAIAVAFPNGASAPDPVGQPVEPGTCFPPRTRCAGSTIKLAGASDPSIVLRLIVPEDALACLRRVGPIDGARNPKPAADAGNAPWAAVTLPLRAVLAETRLPLARVAALCPGEIIALPLSRSVPLLCGERIVAHGTMGEQDERAALRITAPSQDKEPA